MHPLDLSATALSQAIRDRHLSCRELMQATLARIHERNPAINAIVSLRDESALLQEADTRDAELAAGHWRGPLHGLPHAVKDLAATAGLRTTLGSPLLAEVVPRHDAFFVSRLRAAGAVFVGKTNVPEFGLGSQSYNTVFGVTRNPHDPSCTAGGSSGGAAAALAARMLPLADGSDMMGSLRNPAAFCGVYGFRPSFGVVPAGPGTEPYLQQLSTDGPMARTMPDLLMLLGTMAGHEPRAPMSLPGTGAQLVDIVNEPAGRPGDDTWPAHRAQATPERPLAGVRVGWLADWGGHLPMEDGVLDTCAQALRTLADLGAEVVDLPPPFPAERLWDTWLRLRSTLVGGRLAVHWNDERRRARMKPEAQWEAERGARATALDFYAASEARAAWHEAALRAFEHVDLMVLPSAQVFPFDADLPWPRDVAGHVMDTYHRWMEVTVPASLLGAPALAVPAGTGGAHGLPMGVQLIGAPRRDRAVLRVGLAYDRAFGMQAPARFADRIGEQAGPGVSARP